MIHESLFEFEQSLNSIPTDNELMLNSIDLRADLNRCGFAPSKEETLSKDDIQAIFDNYDFTADADSHTVCSDYSPHHGLVSDLESHYWVALLNSPYKTVVTLPNYTKLVFLQTGVPAPLRAIVWQRMAFVNHANHLSVPEVSRQLFANFQHSYNREITRQIEKDLPRTFPELAFFQTQETISALLTVLNVYANYDLELGYCQGLLFLVGTLYRQFKDAQTTFHVLCKIMECEPELRGIFVAQTMSSILDKWHAEFMSFFLNLDPELALHLADTGDTKVFLYQWWLTFSLIHAPSLHINNRIVDFCFMEGWKVGIFKISAGLLIKNKPILMSLDADDAEVLYQHLLNESKWGNIVNSATSFFGDLLVSWKSDLFAFNCAVSDGSQRPKHTHKRTVSVFDKFKNFTLSTSSITRPSNGPESASSDVSSSSLGSDVVRGASRSFLSVFSKDADSIYLDVTSSYSEVQRGSSDFLKLPPAGFVQNDVATCEAEKLAMENLKLKCLLERAYTELTDELLRSEIKEALAMGS